MRNVFFLFAAVFFLILGCKETAPVFQAWSPVENIDNESEEELIARHDMFFGHIWQLLNISWQPDEDNLYEGLATKLNEYQLEDAQNRRNRLLALNPKMKLLAELRYRDARFVSEANEDTIEWWRNGHFPPDSPFWLKDTDGNQVVGWAEDTNLNGRIDENDEDLYYLIDFTNPDLHSMIGRQAEVLKDSGLFDGIMLDWFNEIATTDDAIIEGWNPILSKETEVAARIALLKKIREFVGDDFIIMGNCNYNQNPNFAPYLNAVFLECYKNNHSENYTDDELEAIEKAVIFYQNNCASPAYVCLEGWRICTEYDPDLATRIAERNSETNMQTMRLFTTMSLTLTNGAVLFSDDNALPFPDHLHNWYDFWDVNIGFPLDRYQVLYENISGLYIREFAYAWVVYNRSGSEQEITFQSTVRAVTSDEISTSFYVPDKDGEIFLK